jgi:hypothetical protein
MLDLILTKNWLKAASVSIISELFKAHCTCDIYIYHLLWWINLTKNALNIEWCKTITWCEFSFKLSNRMKALGLVYINR